MNHDTAEAIIQADRFFLRSPADAAHDLSPGLQVAGLQRRFALVTQTLDEVQIINHPKGSGSSSFGHPDREYLFDCQSGEKPVKNNDTVSAKFASVSELALSGSTPTVPSGRNSKHVIPPNEAMY